MPVRGHKEAPLLRFPQREEGTKTLVRQAGNATRAGGCAVPSIVSTLCSGPRDCAPTPHGTITQGQSVSGGLAK